MTRENLYVAMTRGREANRAYVAVDRLDAAHLAPHPADDMGATGRSVLAGVLARVGAEPSAHEALAAEQEAWGSIAQLAAEYETIAAVAGRDRWAALLRSSGLSEADAAAAVESDAFGPLTAELRRAEANHYDVDALLPRLVRARAFDDADDVAAVLRHRVAVATARPVGSSGASGAVGARSRRGGAAPRLIAGLIPEAAGEMSDEMRQALTERRELIEARADAVLDEAVAGSARWVPGLGDAPTDPRAAATWRQSARIVAAYRDRYQVIADAPLGAPPESTAQKIDRARAEAALRALDKLGQPRDAGTTPRRAQEQRGLQL